MIQRLFVPFLLLLVFVSKAQTPISGIVNSYASVTQFTAANQSVTLASSVNYSVGDLVLIIQMQGATIDETLSNDFGTILDYGNAGNYEVQRICRKNGNSFFFSNPFINDYNANEGLQVVKIPEYNDANLTANVTGSAWNGSTGGIIALKVNGVLNLDTFSIDASGIGFRGGEALPSGGGCLPISWNIQYSDKNSGDDRALKGEGIAEYIPTKECSRGPQANGGGGGNNHNGGGAGGSNYGIGGAGGQRVKPSALTCGSVVGLDSKPLVLGYSSKKLFTGGGGGAGHGNNLGLDGESGLPGGGIVIVICDTIKSNGGAILAQGLTGLINSESEGGGGGGAGGTIICLASSFSSPINVDASGGKGTKVDNIGSGNCSGPGGGGGGGFIGTNAPASSSNLIATVKGGASGSIATFTQPGCSIGKTNGAKSGTNGKIEFGFLLNDNSSEAGEFKVTETACNKYFSPSGKYLWTTTGIYKDTAMNVAGCDSLLEINLTIVPVDTSVVIEQLTLISNAIGANYQWIDCDTKQEIVGANQSQFSPTYNGNFALVVGTNGCTDTSGCHTISTVGIEESQFSKHVSVFPNPSNGVFNIELPCSIAKWDIQVTDLSGKLVYFNSVINSSNTSFELDKSGYFIIEIIGENEIFRTSILKRD